MIEFHKLADGTWKRSGEASPSEEPVTISFHNARSNGPCRTSLEVSAINPSEPNKVQHSGDIEGEFSWSEAIKVVEDMIRDGEIEGNLFQIQSSIYRLVGDAFLLAQHDLVAKHPEWLRKDIPPVPPGFHKYSVDICRSDGQAIMSRVGSLELMQLIKERLSENFSGRICDPDGKVIDEWTI
jgi:hypothetical protein